MTQPAWVAAVEAEQAAIVARLQWDACAAAYRPLTIAERLDVLRKTPWPYEPMPETDEERAERRRWRLYGLTRRTP